MKKYERSDIYNLAKQLRPINRSLTGDGARHTFAILKEILRKLNIF
jgi:aminopeptidase-like protein